MPCFPVPLFYVPQFPSFFLHCPYSVFPSSLILGLLLYWIFFSLPFFFFFFFTYQLPIFLILLLPISFIHVSHFSSILFSISLVMNYLHSSSFTLSQFPHSLILCFLLPLFYISLSLPFLFTTSLWLVSHFPYMLFTNYIFCFTLPSHLVFPTQHFPCFPRPFFFVFLHFYLPFSLFSHPYFNPCPCSLLPSCSLIQK
jgi:hypothetical protein